MLTSIDVKFPSSFACFSASSGDKGMISSADILQIVDIFCWVVRVFLLFLAVVRVFCLQFKSCEKYSAILVLLSWNDVNLDSKASELLYILLHLCYTYIDVIFHTSQNVFQIWSTLGGYEELASGALSQSETENYILSDKWNYGIPNNWFGKNSREIMGLTEIFGKMEAVHRAKNQLVRVRLSKAMLCLLHIMLLKSTWIVKFNNFLNLVFVTS